MQDFLEHYTGSDAFKKKSETEMSLTPKKDMMCKLSTDKLLYKKGEYFCQSMSEFQSL